MIEEARRTGREEPTHTTEELRELLELDDDDNLEAQASQPTGAAGKSTPRPTGDHGPGLRLRRDLAPGNMQERQFIPDVGMTPHEFWSEVDLLAQREPGGPHPDVHVLHAPQGQ